MQPVEVGPTNASRAREGRGGLQGRRRGTCRGWDGLLLWGSRRLRGYRYRSWEGRASGFCGAARGRGPRQLAPQAGERPVRGRPREVVPAEVQAPGRHFPVLRGTFRRMRHSP